ncbi:RHS repeat-associated core domain-containing protein [Streptomyces sp. CAU 1734]|uniref:RHS repeat-associated core domain-containing protein n=1 Tax=Streptomyces sp. CAU 1734 TaxID=3140360 RepID=UPI003260C113
MSLRSRPFGRRLPGLLLRSTVLGLSLTLAGTTVQAVAFTSGTEGAKRPGVQNFGDPIDGRDGKALPRPADRMQKSAVTRLDKAVWPKGGNGELPVTNGKADPARTVGGLPVAVTATKPPAAASARSANPTGTAPAPDRVRVEVLPAKRASDLNASAVLRVQRTDATPRPAKVRLTVDYTAFADGYGGSYGARLRLVQLPACAATAEPGSKQCPELPTPLRTVNDPVAKTASAEVFAAAAPSRARSAAAAPLVALSAGASSSQGSFAATGLAPSAKWSVAPSTGGFTWSYPMRTVPVAGALTPQVGLSYSSQGTDGRTSTTNNQGSWVGEGFGYEPGYIERQYKPCTEDGHKGSAEQCWAFDNATVMLDGNASQIIKDDKTGNWKLTAPNGAKIDKVKGTGTNFSNGDNDGEYWRITTADSKQYFFGLNRLPGWTTGKEETNSVWTAPVFSDDAGEPCYNADFSKAHCKEAWRWNLDYVKDPHGNVISYFYEKETNHYALNGKTDVNGTAYDRGGYLERIDYGQRDQQVYAAKAPARVTFNTAERCLPDANFDCAPAKRTKANAARWPDVPVDRECKAGVKCEADQISATFFTTKRLTSVVTQMRKDATTYQDVDAWNFTHLLLDNGDASKALWLWKIDHEGRVGTTVKMPSLELSGIQMDNRVDAIGDNISPFKRHRLALVLSESGAQLDVNYSPTQCTVPTLPAPGESVKRCYPVKWMPPGYIDPVDDWFHKYVVDNVIQTDRTGGSDKMVTRYTYLGDAGWRHAKPDGITPDKLLTWGDWQGYGKVKVTTGSDTQQPTRVEHTYFQGLNGDKQPGGGKRVAEITDSAGTKHTDDEDFTGFELETTVYNKGAVASKVIKHPWKHHTATQTSDWGTLRSTLVAADVTLGFTALAAGGWRETKSSNLYDKATGTGRIDRTEELGLVVPASATAEKKAEAAKDDTCTRTFYADNTTGELNFLGVVERVETVQGTCAATPDRRTQVVSDVINSFDGKVYGTPPTRGLTTRVERLKSHNGTKADYQETSSTTYDQYGRPESSTIPATGRTRTEYTMANGLTTQTKVFNQLEHAITTEYEPAWGQTKSQLDANGKRTDLAYDGLGRMVSVWHPDRSKAGNPTTPSTKYSYLVRRDEPAVVKQEILETGGTYAADYTLYDSLLRPRQRQSEALDGTRLVADTIYDSWGRVRSAFETYHTAGAPSDKLETIRDNQVPAQTRYEFDDMGRPSATVFVVKGTEQWRTTTKHEGDRTHVIPPQGGVAKTSVKDADDRIVELIQYQSGIPGSAGPVSTTSTKYAYTPTGALAKVTDSANNEWSFEYDQRGRQVKSVDPDAGTTLKEYDDADRVVLSTHDGTKKAVKTTYDKLGRVTFTHDGAGTALTEQRYDRAGALGRQYGSLRFIGGTESFGEVIQSFDTLYRPLRTAYLVPASQGKLAGTYLFNNAYNADGTLQSSSLPAAGGLPAEVLVNEYDDLQRPTTLRGTTSYVTNTVWSPTSDLLQYEANTGAKKVWNTFEYETGTKRVSRAMVDIAGTTTGPAKDTGYSYDQNGNVLSMSEKSAEAAGPDVQCFRYDTNQRLSEAWTPAATATTAQGSGTVGTTAPVEGSQPSACAAAPGASPLGGPAAYWKSYRTDAIGNRTEDITHDTGLVAAKDVKRTFAYGEGPAGPHSVTKVTTDTPTGDRNNIYRYDTAGNTISRNIGGDTSDLEWSADGKLTKASHPDDVTTTDKNEAWETTYLYDAAGNRVQGKDAKGTTVYLPGMELHQPANTTTVEATRYYAHAGQTVAVRTSATKVSFVSSDHHGTGDLAVDSTTGAVTKRRFDPYGNSRDAGPAAAWPGTKGFVGGTMDESTSLTHLGAREYDPSLGKFISVDPIIDYANAQQMNGYSYGNNSPVTYSDPSGLIPAECGMGEISCTPNDAGGFDTKKKKGSKKPGKMSNAERDVILAEGDSADADAAPGQVVEKMVELAKDIAGINAVQDCISNPGIGTCTKAAAEIALNFAGAAVKSILKADKILKALDLLPDLWKAIGKAEKAKKKFDKAKDALAREQEAAKCLTKHSFLPGTLVLMGDGSKKKIEDVKLGDKVLTTDPDTGENAVREVVGTIVTEADKEFVNLAITRGKTTSTLVSTTTHPFWVPSEQEWIEAGRLRPGMELHTPGGDRVQMMALRSFEKQQRTHDLTISGIHAYYVLAGATPVLVHNNNCDPLQNYADSLRPGATKKGPHVAAEYTSPSGLIYFGRNGHGLSPKAGGDLERALRESGHHGGCAEVMCLIQAEAAEGADSIRGGSMRAVRVRGLRSEGNAHGTPISPCPNACTPLLGILGINN